MLFKKKKKRSNLSIAVQQILRKNTKENEKDGDVEVIIIQNFKNIIMMKA